MWNSLGSYFVHTPPGLRKSGIPDSVLMPAPVNTTMRRASRTNALSCSTGSLMIRPFPQDDGSLPAAGGLHNPPTPWKRCSFLDKHKPLTILADYAEL